MEIPPLFKTIQREYVNIENLNLGFERQCFDVGVFIAKINTEEDFNFLNIDLLGTVNGEDVQ